MIFFDHFSFSQFFLFFFLYFILSYFILFYFILFLFLFIFLTSTSNHLLHSLEPEKPWEVSINHPHLISKLNIEFVA